MALPPISRPRLAFAATLALAALPGGLRPGEIALVLGVALLVPAPEGEESSLSARMEGAILVAITLAFLVPAAALLDADRPVGTDWMAYLRNAVALATGNLTDYQRWRGPLYAWACLALAPVGGLVLASQVVSLVAATACVPLTWALGRRLAGPLEGLLAAVILAGWADLRPFAVASTPYALLAVLTLAAVVLLAEGAARRGWTWYVGSGVMFGLAAATDLRAIPVAILALGVAAFATFRGAIVAAVLAFVVGKAALATLPVEMVPLSEQVALQRDLNAREGRTECGAHGGALPSVQDLVGRCGRSNLAANLERGERASAVGLAMLGVLAAVGFARTRRPGRGWLVAAALPTAPSLLVIGVQHRYLVPVAPFAAVAFGASLGWAVGGWRPWRVGIGMVLVAAVSAAGAAWPGSLWARATAGAPAADLDPAMALSGAGAYGVMAASLRASVAPGERVADCARAGLTTRLYPIAAEELPPGGPGHLSKPCRRLLEDGPTRGKATWLLLPIEPERKRWEGWETIQALPQGGGVDMVLLKGSLKGSGR